MSTNTEPLVILMDCTHKLLTYSKTKGTNADVIENILRDTRLPIRIIKETTSPEWERAAQVKALNPNLIIIHGSAFVNPDEPVKLENPDDDKFLTFLKYMKDTSAKFLVYSRGVVYSESPIKIKLQLARYAPGLGRVDVLHVKSAWDSNDAQNLVNKTKSLLGLS